MEEQKKLERFLSGIVLGVAALYIFFCLVSFNLYDRTFPFFQAGTPLNDQTMNFGGSFGAYLSGTLVYLFGTASYLLVILLLFLLYNSIWGRKERLWRKIAGTSGLMLAFSAILSLRDGMVSGGNVGFLLGPYLADLFGTYGVFIILGIVILLSFLAGYNVFILPVRQLINSYAPSPGTEVDSDYVETRPAEAKTKTRIIKNSHSRPANSVADDVLPEPVKEEIRYTQKTPSSKRGDYQLPPIEMLKSGEPVKKETREDLEIYAQVIEETLSEFGIEGEVVELSQGPRVTMYEIQLAPGVQVQKVYKIQDNLAMNLKTTTIRVVAPLPNKSTVGIEVPNREISVVYLKDIINSKEFRKSKSKLTITVGKNIMGRPVVTDLKQMPHLLIAGATGSGKTVCLNSLITSILYKATPEEVKFIMIDPKMVELTFYNDLPHLLCPVVVDINKAVNTLKWLIAEMGRRYKLFSGAKTRNIEGYNAVAIDEYMPYIVVVIDELADLMMVAKNEIERSIIRLAQLSRAAGIHLLLANQRPSVNVITGVIKANLPSRISFQVTSKFDSRTILDSIGAEKLLGRGDLLFMPPGTSSLIRIQGCYVDDSEIEAICEFIKKQDRPEYDMEILESREKPEDFNPAAAIAGDEEDDIYNEAKKIVIATKIASISMLQRRLKIGFNRAARLIEQMDEEGMLGPYREGKPRQVIAREENDDQ